MKIRKMIIIFIKLLGNQVLGKHWHEILAVNENFDNAMISFFFVETADYQTISFLIILQGKCFNQKMGEIFAKCTKRVNF